MQIDTKSQKLKDTTKPTWSEMSPEFFDLNFHFTFDWKMQSAKDLFSTFRERTVGKNVAESR